MLPALSQIFGMVALRALHPVVIIRPAPRTGRPRLQGVPVVSTLEIVQEESGFLSPLPPALSKLLTRPDRAPPFVERTLRLGPGGIWAMLRIPDPDERAAQREARDDLDDFGDGLGLGLAHDLGIEGEPHIRAATPVEAVFILKGMEQPLPRSQSWLRLTPFCTVLDCGWMPEGGAAVEPTEAEFAEARARLARWTGANLRLCQDALWIRFGVPGLPMPSEEGAPWLHPAGVGHDLAGFRDDDFGRAPRLASPLSPERRIGHARRLGEHLDAQAQGRLLAQAGEIRRFLGHRGDHDGIADAFVNLACTTTFLMAGRTGGKRTSTEAAALRPALDAAVADLARWAAHGSTWTIERADWPEAIGAVERVARLLIRSHPWSRDVEELESLMAYAEEAVLPLVRNDTSDEDALALLAPSGHGERTGQEPAPFAFPASALTNAPVLDRDGTRIGRLASFSMAADGRATTAVLKVGARRIEVPFPALSFEPGADERTVIVTADPALIEGLVPIPAPRVR